MTKQGGFIGFIIFVVLLLVGCVTAPEPIAEPSIAPPTTNLNESVFVNEPAVTENVSVANAPKAYDASCLDSLDFKAKSWSSVLDTTYCFLEKGEAYDCTFLLTRLARDTELEQRNIDQWVQRLYDGAYHCAKTIPNELPSVKAKRDGSAQPSDLTILNYYDCYNSDAICSTTSEEIDALINAMGESYE